MRKKLLSILLSLAMVVTMMPAMTMTAFAETTTTTVSTTWTDLVSAINAASPGDTIMLGADLSAEDGNSALEINKELTLDLNGYMLDANYDESMIESILKLTDGGILTIQDSTNPSAKAHDIYSCNGWDVNLGHWVTYKPDGYDEEAEEDKKHISINGGLITGTYGAAGVYVGEGAKCTLDSGTIAGNVSWNDGGGVYVCEGATFEMNGGTISYNEANYGGGVAVGSRSEVVDKGEFILNGGSVSNNIAYFGGGGVYVSAYPDNFTGPYFTMTGGTVSDNESNSYGGGVALEDCDGHTFINFISRNPSTIMKMTGGTITNNFCGSYGGGVFFCAEYEYGSVSLGGTAVISGNWCGDPQNPTQTDPADNFRIGVYPKTIDHGIAHAHEHDGFIKFDEDSTPTLGMNVGVAIATDTGIGALMNPVAATSKLATALTNINSYLHPDDLNYQVKCTKNEGDTTTYQIELVEADRTKPLFDPRSGTGMVLNPDTGCPTTNPSRAGHVFLGWYDESGNQIHDGQTFVGTYTKFDAGSIYYAHWQKIQPPTFILGYTDSGDEDVWDCTLGENNVPTTIPVKEDYKFAGWFDDDEDADDAIMVHNGKSFVNSYTEFKNNTKYFAHWVEDVPAKFYVNDNQLTGDDLNENGLPKNMAPAHDYCAFGGWFDAKTGGNRIHDGEMFVGQNTEFTPGASYYARWFVLDASGNATEHIPLDKPLKFDVSGNITIGASGTAKAVSEVEKQLSQYGITASWKNTTPKKWTITLENACISVTEGIKYSSTTYADIVTANTADFVLKGRNTITAKTNATMTPSAFTGVFAASKALTFSGDGSLLVDLSGVTGTGVDKRGIWVKSNTMTNSATLTTKGTNKAGIAAENGLTNGGSITAEDTTCGVFTSDKKPVTNNSGTIVGKATEGYRGVRVGGDLTVKGGSVTGISGGKEGHAIGSTEDGNSDSCGVFVKGNIIVSGNASVTGEVSGDAATDACGVHADGTITLADTATINGKANAKLPTKNNYNYGVSTKGGFAAIYRAVNTNDDVLTLSLCKLKPTDATSPVVISNGTVEPSTYELVLTPPKSSTLNQACEASVQLKHKEIKDKGYGKVQIKVAVTTPEDATPVIEYVDQDIVSKEYLGDENFSLTKAFDKTYPISLTFDKTGDYTLTFTVVDVDGEEGENVICTETMKITVSKPELTGTVEITGTANVGEKLTGMASDLSDSANIAYQWYRCDSAEDLGTAIKDATGDAYTLTPDDHGKYIKFRVIATAASEYGGFVSSAATDTVKMNSIYSIKMVPTTLQKDVVAGVATDSDQASFTIKAEQVNELDYESVRVKFEVTKKPENANVTIYETADDTKTDLIGGFWKPDGMALAKDYNTNTPITMLFDKAGDYTVKLSLVNKKANDAVICDVSKDIKVEKPKLTGKPVINGTAIVGETLTANVDALSDKTNITYQWYRRDSANTDGTAISGATESTYTLTADDYNKYIAVVVNANDTSLNKGFVKSDATEAVKRHTEYTLNVTAPEVLAANEKTDSAKTNFTIAAKIQYDLGYDSVSVKVEVTKKPDDSTVTICDTENPSTDLVGNFWKPDGMTLAKDYNAATSITMLFDKEGDYTVKFSLVDKNKDDAVICDKEINVTVQEHSTYKFTSAAPTTCGVGQDCSGYLVTVASDSKNALGYDKARIQVAVDKQPEGANIKVNGANLTNDSYLGSVEGFELTPECSKSVPFALNFDTVGEYTVTLTLVNLNNSVEICKETTNVTVKPALTGTVTAAGSACVGEKLTATLSEDFIDKANLTYRWYRCESADDVGTLIKAATTKEYTLTGNDKEKYIKVIVTATNDSTYGGYVCCTTGGVVKLQFTGKPTITVSSDHTPYLGDTIMASIANTGVLDKDDLVLYQWFRCDSATSEGTPITGATEDRYKLTEDDLGKFIRVQITGKDNCPYGGPMSSLATAQVKTPPTAAPEIHTTDVVVTDTTVALPTSGETNIYEYSTDGESWSDKREYTGLIPETQYTYYIREKATDTAMPSNAATVTVYTTAVPPTTYTDAGEIDYSSEVFTIKDGYEISTKNGTTTGDTFEDGKLTPESNKVTLSPGTTYYVRKVATNTDAPASAAISFTTKARPNAPGSTPKLDSKTDTTVTIKAVSGQEYSNDNGTTWVSDNEIGDGDETTGTITFTGLTNNTRYSIITRVKADTTSGSEEFASENSIASIITTKKSESMIEIIDPVDVIDGKIVNGEDKVVVKDIDGNDIDNEKLGDVAGAINTVLSNDEVETFGNTNLYEATKNANGNIVAALQEKTDDEIAIKNVVNAEIDKYLNISLVSANVDVTSTATVTSMVFDVTPMARVTVKDSSNKDVTLVTVIDNQNIESEITFRLPIDSNVTLKTAAVYHVGKFIGNYEVKEESNKKYVEISSKTFSEYGYVLFDEKDAIAKIGDDYYRTLGDAIEAVGNNGTIELQNDSEGGIITIEREVTFTLNRNSKTLNAEIVAGDGFKLSTDGNKYTVKANSFNYKKLLIAAGITAATIAIVKTVDVLVKEAKAEKSAKLLEEAKTAAQQALTEAVGNSTSKTVKKYFNEGTEAVANATTPDEVMNATVEYVAFIGEVKTVLGTKISQNKLTANKNGKIKVSFENPELDGTVNYQVVRSTKKDFSKSKKTYTVKSKSQKTLTYTNGKSLKKGTKYYYKVRAKVELADGTTLYTDWSNVRYTKCKKTR